MTATVIGRRTRACVATTRSPVNSSDSDPASPDGPQGRGRLTRAASPAATANSAAAPTVATVGPQPPSSTSPKTPGPPIHAALTTPVTRAFADGSWASGTHSGVFGLVLLGGYGPT